jgi:hypothetical protein
MRKFKNLDTKNFNVAYNRYNGNYTYKHNHCCSFGHGSDFSHQRAVCHLPTSLLANSTTNCNIVYRGYHGNYTHNLSHCFSLGHGSDFGHTSPAYWLNMLTTVQSVTLFTPFIMVTMVYLQPSFSAWYMAPTSTTRVHHLWVPPHKLPHPLFCYYRS